MLTMCNSLVQDEKVTLEFEDMVKAVSKMLYDRVFTSFVMSSSVVTFNTDYLRPIKFIHCQKL